MGREDHHALPRSSAHTRGSAAGSGRDGHRPHQRRRRHRRLARRQASSSDSRCAPTPVHSRTKATAAWRAVTGRPSKNATCGQYRRQQKSTATRSAGRWYTSRRPDDRVPPSWTSTAERAGDGHACRSNGSGAIRSWPSRAHPRPTVRARLIHRHPLVVGPGDSR